QLQDIGGAGATGLFAVGWTPLAAPRTDAGTEPSADGHGPWVALGDPPQQTDLEQYGDLATLLTMLDAGAPVPSAVLYGVPAADASGGQDAAALSVVTAVASLVRAWAAEPRLADIPLALLTRGAVAADDAGAEPVDPAAAAAWGFACGAQASLP
ncbi:hypothetical protein AB4Z54_65610, partial [Streptomyces sp. MCAF7]